MYRYESAVSDIFSRHHGRIIIATFASNIYRLKHIIETCKENKRKVALFGRSMDTSIDIAIKCGYIKDKNLSQEEVINQINLFVDEHRVNNSNKQYEWVFLKTDLLKE